MSDASIMKPEPEPIGLRNPYDDCLNRLTSTGSSFELKDIVIAGVPMRDFAHRPSHLSELLSQIEANGEHTCLVFGRERITYIEFARKVRAFSASLHQDCSLEHGKKVAILAFNRPEWVIALWGIFLVGGTVVALNSWWTPAEIMAAMQETGTRTVVADAKGAQKFNELLKGWADFDALIMMEPSTAFPSDFENKGIEVLNFYALISEYYQLENAVTPSNVSGADIAIIVFTSGTTAHSRGVMISHEAWIISLMNMGLATAMFMCCEPELQLANENVHVLASLPFFHVGGCHSIALASIVSGHTVIIASGKFDVNNIMSLIEEESVTRWSAVPSMVRAVCMSPEVKKYDLSTVRTIGYGAAPSSQSLQKMAYSIFPQLGAISNAYGLTETGAIFAMNTGKDFREHPDSVGRAFPTAQIRIANAAHLEVPIGQIGEILVRGPFLMTGFCTLPKSQTFVNDHWLCTGDIGYVDAEGFIYLIDRKKDVIIRGGENIFAVEVENRLELHPDIVEAAVISIDSDTYGEEVKAIVRVTPRSTLDEKKVQEWVGAALAKFKVPSVVELCKSPLPRNATGKLLKNVLRESVG